jgi:hypothetical protein
MLPLMSALGQKETLGSVYMMSALPPKADIGTQSRNVRFVPKADQVQCNTKSAIDHFAGRTKGRLPNKGSQYCCPAPGSRRNPQRPFPEEAVLHDCDALGG